MTATPAWRWPSFVGNAYRECLENGTWASRINYSQCEPILDDKVSVPTCPTLGPCISVGLGQSTEDAKGAEPVLVSATHPFLHLLSLPLCPVLCSVTLWWAEKGTQSPTFGRARLVRGPSKVAHDTRRE